MSGSFGAIRLASSASLRAARASPELRAKLVQELGEGIIRLAIEPELVLAPFGRRNRVTWHRVGSLGNALQWCDEVHSSDERLYVWSGNCLRELGMFTGDELLKMRARIDGILALLSHLAAGDQGAASKPVGATLP